MLRLFDVQLKIVNVFRLGSNGAGASPMMLAFDDCLFPALMASRALAIWPRRLAASHPLSHPGRCERSRRDCT